LGVYRVFNMLKRFFLLLIGIFFVIPQTVYAVTFPNDPGVKNQWWWQSIRATDGWTQHTGSKDVVVAVIDTGVDINHPDLKDNIWTNPKEIENGLDDDGNGMIDDIYGWNFLEDNNNPSPPPFSPEMRDTAYNHGTIVAGIIGAVGDNAEGTTGVNWRVSIMPLRALDSEGNGKFFNVTRAIDYAVAQGADIINLSFVTPVLDKQFQTAISRAYHKGVLVVTATGNDGARSFYTRVGDFIHGTNLNFPACLDAESIYSFVLGVASVDKNDVVPEFSDYGICVDVLAPGNEFEGTVVYNPSEGLTQETRGTFKGTSLSSPFAAGAAALIKAFRPFWRADELVAVLRASARDVTAVNPGKVGDLGAGALDVGRAIEIALARDDRYPLHTIHKQDGVIQWQAFDGSFKKRLYVSIPVSFERVAGWDVFDYDRDQEDEFIVVEVNRGRGRVRVFNMNGVEELSWNIENPIVGGVLISAMRPHEITTTSFRPGIGLLFSSRQKVMLVAYNADGTQAGSAVTPIQGRRGVGHLDIRWSERDEVFIVSELTSKGVTSYNIAPDGNTKETIRYPMTFSRRDMRYRPAQFMFADLYAFREYSVLFASPAAYSSAVSIFSGKGVRQDELQPFNSLFKGGVHFDVGDWDLDGEKEVVVASGSGSSPQVRIYNTKGELEGRFRAGPLSLTSGIDIRISQYR